jgi:hypothetical protein
MAHTSGLADNFEGRSPDGPTTSARVVGADFGWNIHQRFDSLSTSAPRTASG